MVKIKAIRRVITLNQDGVQVKKMLGTGQLLCIEVLLQVCADNISGEF